MGVTVLVLVYNAQTSLLLIADTFKSEKWNNCLTSSAVTVSEYLASCSEPFLCLH